MRSTWSSWITPDVGDLQRVAEDRQPGRLVLGPAPGGGSSCPAARCSGPGRRCEMFSMPFTSRAMSASPRARSRSIRATALCGSAARVAARLTARVVRADAAAGAEHGDQIDDDRSAGSIAPCRRAIGRCSPASPSARRRAASMSSSADRVGQEVLGPLLQRLQQRLVVVADGQDRQLRVLDRRAGRSSAGPCSCPRRGRRWPGRAATAG